MYNYSAGPAMLPQAVLDVAKAELLNWQDSGLSVMEMPFTSDEFNYISNIARHNLKALLNLPDNYHILFLQGGAYAHFSFVAMNLLGKNKKADYVQTGHWSTRAINEAKRYGQITTIASSEHSDFQTIPPEQSWQLSPNASYCHITTNETANGVQFRQIPTISTAPLVADATSDFLTREIDISQFGLIYASAQKNIGPTGLTIVIIRDDLLDQATDYVPTVFNYSYQVKNNNRVNTPSTYSIYIAGLMFSWLLEKGGINQIEQQNQAKADRLYHFIDNNHFYHCNVEPEYRSMVNICFELTKPALLDDFIAQAKDNGLLHLKGHGVRGGIRASLYNAMPIAGVDILLDFMHYYATKNT